jgi:hypothetical protein
MTRKLLLILALSVGLAALASAAPSTPVGSAGTTVGEFALRLATAIGYDPVDARAAAGVLKGRGIPLAADLSAALTEGEAARVLSGFGIAVVAPASPATPVSSGRAANLAAAISGAASIEGRTVQDGGPTQCLSSRNRGECNNCCKEASGLGGQFCGQFCHANVPPPVSPDEPQP